MKDSKSKQENRLNKLLDNLLSKKFLCLILGTVLLARGSLTGEQWIILACIYIGVDGALNIFTNKNGTSKTIQDENG